MTKIIHIDTSTSHCLKTAYHFPIFKINALNALHTLRCIENQIQTQIPTSTSIVFFWTSPNAVIHALNNQFSIVYAQLKQQKIEIHYWAIGETTMMQIQALFPADKMIYPKEIENRNSFGLIKEIQKIQKPLAINTNYNFPSLLISVQAPKGNDLLKNWFSTVTTLFNLKQETQIIEWNVYQRQLQTAEQWQQNTNVLAIEKMIQSNTNTQQLQFNIHCYSSQAYEYTLKIGVNFFQKIALASNIDVRIYHIKHFHSH